MIDQPELQKLFEHIRELADSKFYGGIEIKMENGKVVVVRETKSIKF